MSKTKGKKDVVDVPQVRMVKPDAVLLASESGRVFQFELGREEVFMSVDHTQEEVDELKEQSLDIPEDFYEKRWIRYRFKLPDTTLEPVEGEKGVSNADFLDPQDIPEEDKLYTVQEENGVFNIDAIKFALDSKFRPGAYTLSGKEVTLGLSSAKRMPDFLMLLKIVDLNEEAAKLEETKTQLKGKKR